MQSISKQLCTKQYEEKNQRTWWEGLYKNNYSEGGKEEETNKQTKTAVIGKEEILGRGKKVPEARKYVYCWRKRNKAVQLECTEQGRKQETKSG